MTLPSKSNSLSVTQVLLLNANITSFQFYNFGSELSFSYQKQ
jgi:hypothetical protein